jgi:N-acetylglucosaminyldiphosphoundecaprenol N-acetyl-beta-D-mannosaminyltransferase
MNNKLPSIKILGTDITVAPHKEVLEYIIKRVSRRVEKFYIVTPNPEILMYAVRSKAFQDVLNNAEVSIPDGIGVPIAGRILKKQIMGRITGVDFMDELCRESAMRGLTVGFLGGRGGVAKLTAECLREKYPNLRVNFIGEEWPQGKIDDGLSKNKTHRPLPDPKSEIRNPASHIDILFVAFGFPKQEEWIAKNLPEIDVTCAMGVGGAFDYISGKIFRAPRIVRRAGMEWAFRLGRQPWRARRQLALPQFMFAVLEERFQPAKISSK